MPLTSDWSLVVCGGGSGGHLFPALAVIAEMQRQSKAPDRILFLTAERFIDQKILELHNIEHVCLPAIDSIQLRKNPIRAIRKLWSSTGRAIQILNTMPAPVLLGTGGFGSVPGILAGRWRKRPIILLEQNVIPGRATSFLCRFADVVCLSFFETRKFFKDCVKTVVTGNPIRTEIARLATSRRKKPAISSLLILGGSQGAAAINAALLKAIPDLRANLAGWKIFHQTGQKDYETLRAAYAEAGIRAEVSPFFPDMTKMYRRTRLIVTRAGGTSLAEIACAGIPAIIVPFPKSLRNHQQINARHFTGHKAAILVEQSKPELFAEQLVDAIKSLIENETKLNAMATAMQRCARPDAAHKVADLVYSHAERSEMQPAVKTKKSWSRRE